MQLAWRMVCPRQMKMHIKFRYIYAYQHITYFYAINKIQFSVKTDSNFWYMSWDSPQSVMPLPSLYSTYAIGDPIMEIQVLNYRIYTTTGLALKLCQSSNGRNSFPVVSKCMPKIVEGPCLFYAAHWAEHRTPGCSLTRAE